ncbi:MAG: GatB/YqeY domain-containing protein [Proteobacteria bacterium]|nr:GatB/YqeY domain-containing protein [Pseudomonadota bacterium]
MSDTKTRLSEDIKKAMKEGEKDLLAVLRMIYNEVRNAEINDLKEPGRLRTEAEVVQIIAAYQKQLQKSMAEYPADRQAPLKAELAIVERYLPKALTGAELEAFIKEYLGKTSERTFGILMKSLQGELVGRVDGKSLSETLKRVLG